MKRRPGPVRGLVEDRRVPPPGALLAYLQKLILNPPWMGEDTRDPVAAPVLRSLGPRGMSAEEWAALSAAYRARVAGMGSSVRGSRSGR